MILPNIYIYIYSLFIYIYIYGIYLYGKTKFMFQTTNQIPIAMCICQGEFTSWHSICSWNCQSTTPAANNLCLPADLPSGHGDGSSSMMFPAVNLHYTSIYGRCKPIFSMNCPIIFPDVNLQFSSQWDDVHLWVYHRSFHSLRTKMVHICPRWRKKITSNSAGFHRCCPQWNPHPRRIAPLCHQCRNPWRAGGPVHVLQPSGKTVEVIPDMGQGMVKGRHQTIPMLHRYTMTNFSGNEMVKSWGTPKSSKSRP